MAKDTRLINIYLKIHHNRTLTMDDLRYLAEYDPECFEKTCRNVIYNIPEVQPIMEPLYPESPDKEPESEFTERQSIEYILENLKRLEIDDFLVADMDTDKVKSLLGNLYMELLFPHNDGYAFIGMEENGSPSIFDQKI